MDFPARAGSALIAPMMFIMSYMSYIIY